MIVVLTVLSEALADSENAMSGRNVKPLSGDASQAIQAARRFAGDAADDLEPISPEEEAIMAEIRAQHRRPTKREIRELAKRLAKYAG
jgi:hypothetical protein